MTSNREYPEQRCANPDCRDYFTPYDRRMKYCTGQCRSNYHNDQRREADLNRYGDERDRRYADRLLEGLFISTEDNDHQVHEEVLTVLGLDPDVGTWERNLDTGGFILWFYAYGLERVDENPDYYTIHLRTKTLNND